MASLASVWGTPVHVHAICSHYNVHKGKHFLFVCYKMHSHRENSTYMYQHTKHIAQLDKHTACHIGKPGMFCVTKVTFKIISLWIVVYVHPILILTIHIGGF